MDREDIPNYRDFIEGLVPKEIVRNYIAVALEGQSKPRRQRLMEVSETIREVLAFLGEPGEAADNLKFRGIEVSMEENEYRVCFVFYSGEGPSSEEAIPIRHRNIRERIYPEPYYRIIRRYIGHRPLFCAAAGVFVSDEQQRLLLHRRGDNRLWSLPGGMIEPGEDILEAAAREVREETGFTVRLERLVGVSSRRENFVVYPNRDQLRFIGLILTGTCTGGEAFVDHVETIEVGWFSPEAIPEDTDEYTRKHLACIHRTTPMFD